MKTILSLFIDFLLLSILGTLLGGTILMLYHACLNFVVGEPLILWTARGFLDGIFVFYPIGALFIPMLLIFMLIRHSSKFKIQGMITIIALSLIVWIFIVPFSLKVIEEEKPFTQQENSQLSTGYFRKITNEVLYFTSVTHDNKVNGLRIKPQSIMFRNWNTGRVQTLENETYTYISPDGFADPLIEKSIKLPKSIKTIVNALSSIEQIALREQSKGIVHWLLFCTMIVSLLSTMGLCNVSEWRLVNAVFVITANVFVVTWNWMYFNGYFDFLLIKLQKILPFMAIFKDNFFAVINLFIAIIFATIGIIFMIVHKKKEAIA